MEKRLKKADKVLYRHDAEYRGLRDEKEKVAKAGDLREQGQILATAMQSTFETAMAAVVQQPSFPPPPPPGAHPTNAASQAADIAAQITAAQAAAAQAASAAAVAADAAAGGGAITTITGLTPLKLKWLSAELGHKVSFKQTTHKAISKELLDHFNDRGLVTSIASFFDRHGDGSTPPRGKAERIEALLGLVASIN
jgi:hypothetical protein